MSRETLDYSDIQLPSETRQKNEDRIRSDDRIPCLLCGKGVNEAKAKLVHVCDGGGVIVEGCPSECPDPAGCLACQPIGPHCYRRHKAVLAPFVLG